MLIEPAIEKLLPHVKNRYDLAIVIAKRNRELVDGAEPLVDERRSASLQSLACRELGDEKIVAVPGHVDAYVPIRQEIIDALNQVEEEEEDDEWKATPQEEEPTPTPVSKIRVMTEEDMFYLPHEEDDEDEEEDEFDDAKLSDEDLDEEDIDDVDDVDSLAADDEDDFLDDDLDDIDTESIDNIKGDEDDDILSVYEDYDNYD